MAKKKSSSQKIKKVGKTVMTALKVIGGISTGAIGLVQIIGKLIESIKEIL
jgi:uncharacterized membrane protein YuzA (DUF378 family)